MKKLIALLSLVLLVACSGGGGGGGDNGTPPEINSLTLFRMTAGGWVETLVFDIGDEANMDIFASDPDLDMAQMRAVEWYWDGFDYIEVDALNEMLPTQQAVDYHYFLLANRIVWGPSGNYRECVFLVDAAGNESREVCVNILVQ